MLCSYRSPYINYQDFHLWKILYHSTCGKSNTFLNFFAIIMLMRKLSAKLKELRLDKGLSMNELSKELGVGIATISRWENGQADVKSDQLLLLAKYFKVTTDYLLGIEDD